MPEPSDAVDESEAFDVADQLSRMVADDRISEDALLAVTGVDSGALRRFFRAASPGMVAFDASEQDLSLDEQLRLSVLAAQLTEGLQTADDDRLRGVFEALTIECRLTPSQIARLTGLDVHDVEHALHDPLAMPADKKYQLASRGAYLLGAFNRARGQ